MAFALPMLILLSASTYARAANFHSTAVEYFLSGNKTDLCYDEPHLTDRAECVEKLVSLYYGDYFTIYCPNLANRIAAEKCKRCPWDKVNASAITLTILRNLNASELFHAPGPNCSVSKYLTEIITKGNELYLSFFGFAVPLFSGMFLAKSNTNGSPTTPQVFGFSLMEPIYFVFLWVLFFVGYGLSISGREMYAVCHDPLSFTSLEIGDWVNLAIMAWTSLWRCRYLEARDRPQEVISWASYRGSALYQSKSVWNRGWSTLSVWVALY